MKYRVLNSMREMCDTLAEASAYLISCNDKTMVEQIYNDGKDMLAQMQETIECDRESILSGTVDEQLANLIAAWNERKFSNISQYAVAFKKCLENNIWFKIRAVFFSEIGEKWDAMESVYKFMASDDRFDPIIVRTPVFREVEQNGQKKKNIIYKDFLKPLGIPSIGYTQYDIEQDEPDVAFISQPYESCTNYEFWPENIAKYTRLVYLIYWVPHVYTPETKKILCDLDIYYWAWKVIGVSEKHKKVYSRHNPYHDGSNMIVTGSPKWDPFYKLRYEKKEMPEEWKKKLEGKKTFIWNTTYSIGNSSYIYFSAIFKWFTEHKECALIWRPHPMSDTVTKMYYSPEVYSKFLSDIQAIDMSDNMVMDRESSYEASFSNTVAMLSDRSSLICQYLILDKPVLYIDTGWYGGSSDEDIINMDWPEKADSASGIIDFLERIIAGKDDGHEKRKAVYESDMPLADGHCGERVSEEIYNLILSEDWK